VDAYLEEELYDLITFCIQNSSSTAIKDGDSSGSGGNSDNDTTITTSSNNDNNNDVVAGEIIARKKERILEIGRELAADGGADAMENMFFAIENRIQGEIGADARPYRSWWNDITSEWKY
jgi:hypothetical protein